MKQIVQNHLGRRVVARRAEECNGTFVLREDGAGRSSVGHPIDSLIYSQPRRNRARPRAPPDRHSVRPAE